MPFDSLLFSVGYRLQWSEGDSRDGISDYFVLLQNIRLMEKKKFFQLHAVSCTQHGREFNDNTLRFPSPFSAESILKNLEASVAFMKNYNYVFI